MKKSLLDFGANHLIPIGVDLLKDDLLKPKVDEMMESRKRERECKRLCGKVVSIRAWNDLTGYTSSFARRPCQAVQTTLHTPLKREADVI